jgi:predicted molibdopterin-dependent oxidoreductase YjgC
MAKIRIDNREFETADGVTVMQAARDAGFAIPSLCHRDGLPHYTSCMVCMVKDNSTNSFFASCSVPVRDGMDIDVSSEDVISLRKKSVELLLLEHRAECEAPCRMVCPEGYNIPLFNRYLSERKFEEATRIILDETGRQGLACINCAGYCENACRRKKIDIPVSIRNMKIFIYNNYVPGDLRQQAQSAASAEKGSRRNLKYSGRFNSMTGKIDPAEQAEWLKECPTISHRFREISGPADAAEESTGCMHCDCRAADNCRLRDLAEELEIKDPRGKLINAPIVKKINNTTGLIFENAKCIKCGLCVRLCEETKEVPALCFINRGFVSIISEPLTIEFEDILKTKSDEVIEICPTGALSRFKK